ncbi:MAG: beta-galactosidase, partial [Anaerolineae bacterium]
IDVKYPDCRMITCDGRTLGPQTNGPRSGGGAPSPCFHHQASMQASYDFLAACVKACHRAPALAIWDAWNEPELTEAIMRDPKLENVVCYCAASRAAFIPWLQIRYDDSLDKLNTAWARNYRYWHEIELPRSYETFRDMIDWRRFFIDTITNEFRTRVRIIRQCDSLHPVMTHTVPFPIFNLVTCASDDFEMAGDCDLFGNSAGSSPNAADLLASAAQGRPVINAEIHAMPGSTFYQNRPLADLATDRYILPQLAHEVKGYMFWQYRPELLGNEAPNWGLTDRQGRVTPWLERVATINRALQSRRDFLLAARNRQAEVGILLDPENELFQWCIAHNCDFYANDVLGIYDALYRANYRLQFVHNKVLPQAMNLPVLICPAPYWLQPETLELLERYVKAGGTLIAEPYFAGMNTENGWHNQVVPGAGWDAIFGCTLGYVLQPNSAVFDAYRIGSGEASATGAHLEIQWKGNSYRVPAFHQVVELQPTTGQVLGTFSNGWPGLVHARYGRGQVFLLGTYLGGAVTKGLQGAAQVLAALAESPAAASRPHCVGSEVRVDILSDGKSRLIIANSLSTQNLSETLVLPYVSGQALVDIVTGERFVLSQEVHTMHVQVSFAPQQVRAMDVVD